MSKTYCERVDSDEDKVTFDDELQTVNSELNWNSDNAKHSFNSLKYRPLFQYRRFKGELDDSDDDCDDNDGKLLKINCVGEQRNDFDLHTTAADDGSAQRIEKNLQDKVQVTQRTLDVALDRPGHWKSSSGMLRSKIVNEKKNETTSVGTKKKKTVHHTRSDTVSKHSTHLVTGCTTLSSKSRDNIVRNIHSLSFQPAWMTSVQSSEGRNVSQNAETDDILDESGQVHQWDDSRGDPFSPSQHQRPVQQWSEPTFSQLQSPGPTPHGLNIGSSGGHSGGRRHTGKARPGSLKARLQKLQHDCDAAENRVVNFKPGPDLTDPRNRAFTYCDVEVVSVLPFALATAPFNVATVVVRQYWTKPAPLSNVFTPAPGGIQEQMGARAAPSLSDQDLHGLAGDLAEEVTVQQIVLSQQTPRKTQTSALSHMTSPDKYTENYATAYFKPSACAGAHRAVRAGVLCRVYNPQFVSGPKPIDDSSVLLHVLCSCWEPIA